MQTDHPSTSEREVDDLFGSDGDEGDEEHEDDHVQDDADDHMASDGPPPHDAVAATGGMLELERALGGLSLSSAPGKEEEEHESAVSVRVAGHALSHDGDKGSTSGGGGGDAPASGPAGGPLSRPRKTKHVQQQHHYPPVEWLSREDVNGMESRGIYYDHFFSVALHDSDSWDGPDGYAKGSAPYLEHIAKQCGETFLPSDYEEKSWLVAYVRYRSQVIKLQLCYRSDWRPNLHTKRGPLFPLPSKPNGIIVNFNPVTPKVLEIQRLWVIQRALGPYLGRTAVVVNATPLPPSPLPEAWASGVAKAAEVVGQHVGVVGQHVPLLQTCAQSELQVATLFGALVGEMMDHDAEHKFCLECRNARWKRPTTGTARKKRCSIM